MNSNLLKFIVGVLLGIAWVVIVVLKLADVAPLVDFIKYTLVGLASHMLTAAATVPAVDPPAAAAPSVAPLPGAAGVARPEWLVAIAAAVLGALLLAGCTTTTASMYTGLATQAKAGIQVFDDNTLATMHDLLCAQPYSAIQRHAELQPGIVALCGPLVNTASLDPAQVTQMLSIAKQLGLGLTTAPAAAASAPAKP